LITEISALTTPAWPYPFWIAHRGAGQLAPENTLSAFRLGASHGYRAFECDVKLSADDVPFLLHDDTLERTTSGHGIAGHCKWSALAQLDAGFWHSPAYLGERMPTLQAVADFCLQHGHALNLEIKPTPSHDAHTGHVVAQQASCWWANQALLPLLSSFSVPALRAAQAAAPHLPRALLLEKWHPDALELVRDLGCAAVVIEQQLVNAQRIDQLHDAGLRVLCYTVNDSSRTQGLIVLGVDGLITDAVTYFKPQSY
jgi:glycerophosphoryl diester phosphodiesterase